MWLIQPDLFKNVIYKPTGGVNEGSFNRHLILHLLNQNFNEPSNFVRIFLALTHLTFAESLMNNNVPFFWEGVDDNDRRIASFISRSGDVIFGMRRKEISKLGLNLYWCRRNLKYRSSIGRIPFLVALKKFITSAHGTERTFPCRRENRYCLTSFWLARCSVPSPCRRPLSQ